MLYKSAFAVCAVFNRYLFLQCVLKFSIYKLLKLLSFYKIWRLKAMCGNGSQVQGRFDRAELRWSAAPNLFACEQHVICCVTNCRHITAMWLIV